MPRPSASPRWKTAWPFSTSCAASTARLWRTCWPFEQDIAGKLNDIENKDELLAALRKELAAAAAKYLDEARSLSKRRYEIARKLEKTVEGEINDLAMKAKFKIEVSGSDEESNWRPQALTSVAYLISTNPGEPMGPIEEIASGGELSRVMLALKASVEAGRLHAKSSDAQRSLVFDEIDTGIGGRAADAVGKKLKALSRTKQVLCITHLPQIASFADRHYLIEKHESAGRTKTTVRPLDAEERRTRDRADAERGQGYRSQPAERRATASGQRLSC